jgi:tetratricopeptide (TPR) repeat protein
LLPQPSQEHVRALLARGRVLSDTGDDWQASRIELERARDEAEALGREDLEFRARLELAYVNTLTATHIDAGAQEALAREALSVLERHQDEEGLARAWFVISASCWVRARWDDMREPLDRSIEHARRAGNRSMELEATTHVLAADMFGGATVEEGLRVARQVLADTSDSREIQAWAIRMIGTFLSLEGRFEEGRALLEQARSIFRELGNREAEAGLAFSTGPLELRAGNPVVAERDFRNALELAQEMGDRGRMTNLASGVAAALLAQGRAADAAEYAEIAGETALAEDASGQAWWRMVTAQVIARRGDFGAAIRLTEESISILQGTQELLTLPDLVLGQADVLRLAGRSDQAATALERAIELFERKGALAEVRRARELLASVAPER